MTHDQINAKVAEILLAEGQEWGYIYCPTCYKGHSRYHLLRDKKHHEKMRELKSEPLICPDCNGNYRHPLNFCSDYAAAWRLLEYILKPKDDERPAKINLWRGLRCGYEDLTWCVSTNTKGKYRCNDTNLKQALAEAFIAAKEKK